MDFSYDIDPLDPEEEERKRQAALSALAAEGGAMPDPMRDAPVELPAQVSPPDTAVELGTLEINAPVPEPPLRDPDELPAPEDERVFRAAEALAAQAEPSKGLDSTERSPEMKEAAPVATPQQPTAQSSTSEAKTEPPAEQDPFEALMRRGEEQRAKMLSQMSDEPSINGWALLADVAFNGGKSIPTMLSQVDADKRAWRERRDKIATGGAHGGDPVSQALQMERIANTREGLKQGKERLTEAQQRRQNIADADQKDRDATYNSLIEMGVPPEKLEALKGAGSMKAFTQMKSQLLSEYNLTEDVQGRVARGEGLKAGARKQTELDVEHANIDRTSEDAGKKAGSVAAAQAPHQNTREDHVNPIERENLDIARRREARESAFRERQDTRQAETDKANWLDTFGKRTEKFRPMAGPLGRLLAQRDAAQGEGGTGTIPGLGVETGQSLHRSFTRGLENAFTDDPATREANERAAQNQEDLVYLADYVLRKETGAAANLTEVQRNALKTASGPRATTLQINTALGILEDLVRSEYQTAGGSRPDWAYESMERAGLGPERWGFKAQTPISRPPIDPTLAPGQTEVLNEEGEPVVEGAGAGPGGQNIPPGNEGFDPMGMVRPQDRADIEAGGTLGRPVPLPKLGAEQEEARKRWSKYRRARP